MNPYGFDWGPMSVERMAHIDGRGYSLSIKTQHVEMQVYVSEKGRKVEACEPRAIRARPEPAGLTSDELGPQGAPKS